MDDNEITPELNPVLSRLLPAFITVDEVKTDGA